jgi:hypothetical protein
MSYSRVSEAQSSVASLPNRLGLKIKREPATVAKPSTSHSHLNEMRFAPSSSPVISTLLSAKPGMALCSDRSIRSRRSCSLSSRSR